MMSSQAKSMQESIDLPFIPESISSHDLAISNFSQVIFPDIPDFFPPDADIKVPYILTEAIEATSRDWIGLFRVGWGSPRDYSTYVWAPKPQDNSLSKARPQSVSFQAYQLPGDDSEFYQFCYVTKQGYVRGASTPFQFRHSTENDCLVEMEDESGMIILRTKSDALEEQLATISQEKAELEESIENFTNEKTELTDRISALETELKSNQEKLSGNEEKNVKLQEELEKLNKDLEENQKQVKGAEEQIKTNKESLDAAEKTIENLKKQIEKLEEQKQGIIDAKATDDEKYQKNLTEKEVKIHEFEREKVTLLDQIKTLTLVKEEAQQQSATQQTTHEKAAKASLKAKEDIAGKLKCCKDERDLFKTQLSNSELQRQETLQQLQVLTDKLQKVENEKSAKEEEFKAKADELVAVQETLKGIEKKHKREINKNQELLRNALERANGEKTAKQLLSKELSETTATRDKLMDDLNKAKKEKEVLSEDLKSKDLMVGTLQVRLEQVEEELEKSESMLLEHEKNVKAEKKRTKEVEKEMKVKINILQQHLQEADHAVAAATSEAAVTTESTRTQTLPLTKDACDGEGSDESKAVVDDLKAQVTDLTTRLNMGADAYKEKFMECHKMERKMKKMKQLLQMKQASATSSSAASTSSRKKTAKDEGSQSWGEAIEKFLNSIADPDAEEKEQAKQTLQKVETLQKNVEFEQGKHRRYKQLYNEEKQKVKTLMGREENVTKALNEAETKASTLNEENRMLKVQLKEFVDRVDDDRLKQMMTYPPESTSGGSSSQDTEDGRDEDGHFEDAPGVPMYAPSQYRSKKSLSEQSTSSDASDEGSYTGRDGSFRMCSGRGEDSVGVDTFTYKMKEKVVSRQPIRSPPLIPDIITLPSQPGTSRGAALTSSSGDARKRKTQPRRKSRKKQTA